jgi:hypothetical protein
VYVLPSQSYKHPSCQQTSPAPLSVTMFHLFGMMFPEF